MSEWLPALRACRVHTSRAQAVGGMARHEAMVGRALTLHGRVGGGWEADAAATPKDVIFVRLPLGRSG